MANKLIVGNWKMNLNPAEASILIHKLDSSIKTARGVEIVLCPPFVDLHPARAEISQGKFKLGAQNMHHLDSGSYTGEISPAMLKGLVDYVILGHSERRIHSHENDPVIAKKVAAAFRNGIVPILCVGDSLMDKQHQASKKVVIDQLTADINHLTEAEIADTVIAYEPVWAIGTGEFAKPDEVQPIVAAIRQTVEELYGEAAGSQVRILYGGSVAPDNARAYLEMAEIDGLLVGGVSLNPAEFAGIIKTAQASRGQSH